MSKLTTKQKVSKRLKRLEANLGKPPSYANKKATLEAIEDDFVRY